MEFESGYVDTSGVKLYYEVHGEGPPLQIIAGYTDTIESWELSFIKELSEHFKLILHDNRGAGRSESPEGEYSTKIMADDAAAVLDYLGIPSAHIFGHSMGGMTAQELALNHPDKVNKLILACTSPGGEFSLRLDGQRDALNILSWLFNPPPEKTPSDVSNEVFEICYHPVYWEKHKKRLLRLESRYPTPISTIKKQHKAILQHDCLNKLHRIKSQTLILHGSKDLLFVTGNARLIKKEIPNAELVIFDDAAHMFIQEKWCDSKQKILEFLTTY